MRGSIRRGEDLKQYVEVLRNKSSKYKIVKKELDDMAMENENLLRSQHLLEHEICNVAQGINMLP